MDVNEIKARWHDLYHGADPAADRERASLNQSRRRSACERMSTLSGLALGLSLALLGLLLYAVWRLGNATLLSLAVVAATGVVALGLYGVSLCLPGHANSRRDDWGSYEEIA